MNRALKQSPGLRSCIVEVLREHREVMHIGELADKLEAAISTATREILSATLPTDSPIVAAAREAGWALMTTVDEIDWKKREQINSITSRLALVLVDLRGPVITKIDPLETHLKELIAANPKQARLAEIDDITRMWFVAELIRHASGRIPLLEIEALVSRHLPRTEGGEA